MAGTRTGTRTGPTTPTAWDSDRKCGAKSGSARRAYAIRRVRCPIPDPLLLIRSSAGTLGCRTHCTTSRSSATAVHSDTVSGAPISSDEPAVDAPHNRTCPNPKYRARHDVLVGAAVGIQLAHHRRHLGRFGIDRRVAEQRTKMWWQDHRQAAGQRLQNVAPERLHPRRMMVIDEEIQLSQELTRIHAPRTESPASELRQETQDLACRVSATENLDDG